MRCFCLLDNVSRRDDEGFSRWIHTHEEEFKGKLIPFGSRVYFKSTTLRRSEAEIWGLSDRGVFAGYAMTLGYGWSGIYLVWKLEDFTNVELRQKSHVINRRLLLQHIVRELEQIEEGIVYPLKAEYERVNNTLEGLKSGRQMLTSSTWLQGFRTAVIDGTMLDHTGSGST